jgi:NAD(P)-dependent dehydrogenase (short-subunit alcohol dehydrogenase family)
MAVDLKSMLLATQAAARPMVERGRGSIVCVSSVAAMRGHGRTAYAAAKAGVIGFVRVNAIAPGQVWTPMVEDVGPELRERRRRASVLGTEGEGWDVGWAAVYLASDEARWVTGQTLVVDGGLSITSR